MKVFFFAICTALVSRGFAFLSPCHVGQVTVIDPRANRTLLTNANCGAILKTTDLMEEPRVMLDGAVKGHNYTLILLSNNQTDQKQGTYLNWLASNIIPNGTELVMSKTTSVLATYHPPPFNLKSGLFKYVFLVYAQKPNSYNPWRHISHQERSNFSVENWTHTYPESTFSLRPVGATEFLIHYSNSTTYTGKDNHWHLPKTINGQPLPRAKSGSSPIIIPGVLLPLSIISIMLA